MKKIWVVFLVWCSCVSVELYSSERIRLIAEMKTRQAEQFEKDRAFASGTVYSMLLCHSGVQAYKDRLYAACMAEWERRYTAPGLLGVTGWADIKEIFREQIQK